MKWTYLLPGLMILLASCVSGADTLPPVGSTPEADNPTRSAELPELPDQGPAPELTNQTWINTDQPLQLADLRGRVVLLEMWTFG